MIKITFNHRKSIELPESENIYASVKIAAIKLDVDMNAIFSVLIEDKQGQGGNIIMFPPWEKVIMQEVTIDNDTPEG